MLIEMRISDIKRVYIAAMMAVKLPVKRLCLYKLCIVEVVSNARRT